MAIPRRRSDRPKRGKALGGLIRGQLDELTTLAYVLNGDAKVSEADPTPDATREMLESITKLVDDAIAVIEPTLSAPYPAVPGDAAARFNALADGASLHYVVGLWRPQDKHVFQVSGDVALRTQTARGSWVISLARFLINRQRDRLRRCPTCHRWFVDKTRNKSARRCSRKCTIAWSNAQRTMKRKTPKRKRGSR